jgi:hypothetical protein
MRGLACFQPEESLARRPRTTDPCVVRPLAKHRVEPTRFARNVQTPDLRATSYLVTLPVELQSGIHATRLLVRGAPWMPPPLQGMAGVDAATGEPRLVLTAETPIHAFPWEASVSKQRLEQLHLEKFCTDFCLAQGLLPYQNVERGDDPPDFVADSGGIRVRVDHTQFAVSSRRGAHAQFAAVRATLFNAPREDYAHLRGLMVFVWASGGRGFTELPPRAPEREALLAALRAYRFNPEAGLTNGVGPLPVAPDVDLKSAGTWRFLATPLSVSAPASPFFLRNGFELAFHFPTDHTARSLWDELVRLVTKHDKGTADELIVSVGAPDNSGFIYPGEQTLFEFMLDQPPHEFAPCQTLKRVLIHEWETGRIVQFHPQFIEIAPAMMMGFVPAHQPLRPR